MYVLAKDPYHARKIGTFWQTNTVHMQKINATLLRNPNASNVSEIMERPLLTSNANETFTAWSACVYLKDVDPSINKEMLVKVCEQTLGQTNIVRHVQLGMRSPSQRLDFARVYFHTVQVAKQAQVLLDGREVGGRKLIARMAEVVDDDDDGCKFVLRKVASSGTTYGLWTSLEKWLGAGSVKDLRVFNYPSM